MASVCAILEAILEALKEISRGEYEKLLKLGLDSKMDGG